MENKNKAYVEELSIDEIQDINGGFLAFLLPAIAIYGGICALAYGAGALYGLATNE